MGRGGKLGILNFEACNACDLAVSPSLPNMTATIASSVLHYKSVSVGISDVNEYNTTLKLLSFK
mgnify:CR=1 FL=1